jgi:hypothetical protein
MKKTGDISMSSPQLPNVQERVFERERYISRKDRPCLRVRRWP